MDDNSDNALHFGVIGLITMAVIVILLPVLLVVGGILALAISVESPAAAASVSQFSGRIAVIGSQGQLATMDAAGDNRRELSGGGFSFRFPSWSPDGQSLAMIGGRFGEAGVYSVIDETGADLVKLFPDEQASGSAIYLSWAPGGDAISFIASTPLPELDLRLVPSDGSESAQRVARGQPFFWDWSDDGQTLLTHSGLPSNGEIALLDMINGERVALDFTPGSFQSPDLSSSGDFLAFSERAEDGSNNVVVLSAENERVLTRDHLEFTSLAWSPQADKLAYLRAPLVTTSSWPGSLWLFDTATGTDTQLSDDRVVAFFWSPDGTQIAYMTQSVPTNSQEANARPPRVQSKPTQTRPTVGYNLWVADVETGETAFLASFDSNLLFAFQFMPFYDQYARSHEIWSPDSRALVLPVVVDEMAFIKVFPADGREPVVIASGILAFWSKQ